MKSIHIGSSGVHHLGVGIFDFLHLFGVEFLALDDFHLQRLFLPFRGFHGQPFLETVNGFRVHLLLLQRDAFAEVGFDVADFERDDAFALDDRLVVFACDFVWKKGSSASALIHDHIS